MKAVARYLATFAAFGLASAINPGYFAGCSSEVVDRFEFEEAELVELLDEANAASPFELRQADLRYRLELAFVQKSGEDSEDLRAQTAFGSRAFACGNRSFMQRASACVTKTGMPLLARFTLYRLDAAGATAVISDRELSGELRVIGTALTNGHIEVGDTTRDTRIELQSPDGKRFELAHFHTQLDGVLAVF